MPALDPAIIEDVTERLCRHLKSLSDYGEPVFIKAGGSAAVYRVEHTDGPRAWKVFNPAFLSGIGGEAERRRLEVQRRLIGHTSPFLIQTYRVEEAEGTAFLEMEFNPWSELTDLLDGVPDEAVAPLITQLVEAVRFLEAKGIVHRDIKPENIHVSSDYKQLKLLDLGVARDIDPNDVEEAAVTDHGNLRPFLATAQYSSPEYLFRLDEPSARLWKGLNIYQVGAVLHDLIMRRPLFQHEMSLGNRWLVARAVLTKVPSFAEGQLNRLSSLKSLSLRCLVKDLDARLQLVGWDDFVLEGACDPLTALQARLRKGSAKGGLLARESAEIRLEFDRSNFSKRFIDRVRAELIPICGTQIPFSSSHSTSETHPTVDFNFSFSENIEVKCQLSLEWQTELYCRTTYISLSSHIEQQTSSTLNTKPIRKIVATGTISESEEETFQAVSGALAECIMRALDLMDAVPDVVALHGNDLLIELENGEEAK